jgi:deoxycytidylate deaminase
MENGMIVKKESISTAIDRVFDETSDFIVVGLTGRTGSGCSTAAQLLSMDTLSLPDVIHSHFRENEARKYRIVKNYVEKKWQKFEWLQVRSIITRYLLELNFSSFVSLCCSCMDLELDDTKRKLNFFKDDYDEAHKKIANFLTLPEETIELLEEKKSIAYEIYFLWLPNFSNKLREALKKISDSAYTKIYQTVGDNIRSSGRADSSEFDSAKVFGLGNTINKVIKSARHHAKKNGRKCYVVIDAIRNPYEAVFLKERYSDFYLISINTENTNRLDHLRKSHKFTDRQIKELDDKEYPSRLIGHKKFTSQNIQKCIEIADIHINNPRRNEFANNELVSQLAWYVGLMMHPGLIMPTSIECCMQIAFSAKKSSGCISRQVGATITDENYSIKAVGWNNTPQGQVPCLLRSVEDLMAGSDEGAFSFYESNDEKFREVIEFKYKNLIAKTKSSGRNLSYCFKDVQNEVDGEKNQVHTRSLHAEENAFLQITKYGGQKIQGGFLFTTASPCELCAKKAYQLGISKIFYIDPYPGIATDHILASGSKNPLLYLFRGAVGVAFHKLYQPIMPYKDELDMFVSPPKKDNKKDVQISRLKKENGDLKDKIMQLEKELKSKE